MRHCQPGHRYGDLQKKEVLTGGGVGVMARRVFCTPGGGMSWCLAVGADNASTIGDPMSGSANEALLTLV